MRQDQYFATLQGSEYLDALKSKLNTYRNFINRSGMVARWKISLGSMYGISQDGKQSWEVTQGGEFGELVQMKVNEYASFIRHQIVLAAKDRPAGMAKAVNTDSKTLRDARIGTQLVEYYLTDPAHDLERDYQKALEIALLAGEAFAVQDWDANIGEEAAGDLDTQQIVKLGDVKQQIFTPWNSARDLGAQNIYDCHWFIFSERVNKYELAAQYPAYAEEIILNSKQSSGIVNNQMMRPYSDDTDYIEVHRFIHYPSNAVPDGRMTLFLCDVAPLDVPYPYKYNNVIPITDKEVIETCFGHTSNYDLLGLEQVTDSLHSVIINNALTFGINTVIGPKGSGIVQTELAKGLRYLEVDPNLVEKIRTLELGKTSREIFEYIQMLGLKKGELSGINSILRGDPQGQLKGASGSAMALLQSQAIEFNSGVQKSYFRLLSAGGSGLISLMQQFATQPRMVKIAGKSNAEAIKEFKVDGEMLNAVSTVIFEPVNPLMQTPSGRLTIAQDLLQSGMLTQPRRYLEVLMTGNLNFLVEDQATMEEAIQEENEHLMDGEEVIAVITENHQAHIMGHHYVISRPDAKKDPALIQRTLAHIQEHVDMWTQLSTTNPQLLAATGQQVLPPMAPPPMPVENPMPGGGPAQVADQSDPAGPQPNLPNPPVNPATGEPAPVAPGTSIG